MSEAPRGSIKCPIRPFGDAYWKRVEASKTGQTGGECCLCGRPIRGAPRFFIAIDLGDHSLHPAAFDVDALGGDFSVERVGSTCARQLRGLGALRDVDGNPVD